MNSKIFTVFVFLFLFFVTNKIQADSLDYYPEPKPSELLKNPITLDNCNGFKIVEWKASSFSKLTKKNKSSIDLMNELCKIAKIKYAEFVKMKFGETINVSPEITVSILPADKNKDGKSFRNLNDMTFRFSKVWSDCCYWGFYIYKEKMLFMRNDIWTDEASPTINKNFVRTFLHEYGHAQNNFSSVKKKYLNDNDEKDEAFIQEYIKFLKIQEMNFETTYIKD